MFLFGRTICALGIVWASVVHAAADHLPDSANAASTLLSRCWSEAALAGTEKERQSTRNKTRVDLDVLRKVTRPSHSPVSVALRGSIRSVKLNEDQKLIALTLDLCESSGHRTGYDGQVIDYLRDEDVKATLFVSGKWFESHPERGAQLIADRRFEIGSHGLRHRDFSRASKATLHDEIHLTESAFLRARGRLMRKSCAWNVQEILYLQDKLTLMRFPYGWCNARALSAVADAGQLAIQ